MSLTNALPADAAKAAKSASHVLATLPAAARNNALTAIHSALSASKEEILAANTKTVYRPFQRLPGFGQQDGGRRDTGYSWSKRTLYCTGRL